MACGRDVNKVESKSKTAHHNERKMKENHHRSQTITQLTAPVTNKAICKRKRGARGRFYGEIILPGTLSTVQLGLSSVVERQRNTASVSPKLCAAQWPGGHSFLEKYNFYMEACLRGAEARTVTLTEHTDTATQPGRDLCKGVVNSGCVQILEWKFCIL